MNHLIQLVGATFGALRNGLLVIFIVALFASNVLLLTNSAFFSVASSLVSKLPLGSLLEGSPSRKQKMLEAENKSLRENNEKMFAERERYRAKVKNARAVSKRIAKRTARNVAVDVADMVAEATPYIGIAFVVADTAMDVNDGCDTVRDVNEILDSLDEANERVDESKVCGMEVPSAEEVVARIKNNIGDTLHQSKENIRESAKKWNETLGGTIDQSVKNVKEGGREFQDALGGTIYQLLHGD